MIHKVIVNCAITGAIHVPSISPYLPIKPEQFAAEAIATVETGTTPVHLHVRKPYNRITF